MSTPKIVDHLRVRQVVAALVALLVATLVVILDRAGVDPDEPVDGVPIDDTQVEPSAAAGIGPTLVSYVSTTEQVTTTWICPGVPGTDPTVTGRVVVANPSDVDLSASVEILGSSTTPIEEAVAVPARGRVTVELSGRVRSPFVGAVVEVLGSVGSVEQVTTHPAGEAIVACARRPSREWHFADGFTGDDSRDSIVITNPYVDAAVIDVTFVTLESGRTPANLKGYVVPARSTIGVSIVDEGARNETVLAVSVRVTAGAVVAGRSQHYLGRGRLGYTMRLGAAGTDREWWFADGEKGEGIVEQFVLFNPGEGDRALSLLFLTGPETVVDPVSVTVPAGGVAVVATADLPQIPVGRYGVVVSSVDGRLDGGAIGVVAEQVVTRREGNSVGTSVVLGAPGTSPSTRWSAPSAPTPGLADSIVVLNATPNAATVSVSLVGPAGAVPIPGLESLELAASGLLTLSVPDGLPASELLVEASEPVVIQRRSARGGTLVGRAVALALPHLPAPSR